MLKIIPKVSLYTYINICTPIHNNYYYLRLSVIKSCINNSSAKYAGMKYVRWQQNYVHGESQKKVKCR